MEKIMKNIKSIKSIKNLLKNSSIRCLTSKQTGEHWFCAVDICQVLCNISYKAAKSYWKTTKQRNSFFDLQKGYVNTQMTLPATDGKLYKMDVINLKVVIYLINTIKHKNNKIFNDIIKTIGLYELIRSFNNFAKERSLKIKQYFKVTGKTVYFCYVYFAKEFTLTKNKGDGYYRDAVKAS
jgi:hypothetical protein